MRKREQSLTVTVILLGTSRLSALIKTVFEPRLTKFIQFYILHFPLFHNFGTENVSGNDVTGNRVDIF